MAPLSFEKWPPEYPLRVHECEGKRSWALYSPCETYRYRLRREWGKGRAIGFLMLNPSTASELKNDPTIERCERRARQLGYSSFDVVNLFAFRSTNPKGLYAANDPIGKDNDRAIFEAARTCEALLCAWGVHGAFCNRSAEIRRVISQFNLFHLGLTKAGEPRHPLYVSYAQKPIEWKL